MVNNQVTTAHSHSVYSNTRSSHLEEEEKEEVSVSNQKDRCTGVIAVHGSSSGNNSLEQNSGNGSNGSSNIGMKIQNQLIHKRTAGLVPVLPHRECMSSPGPMIPSCQKDVMEYENCLNQTRRSITNDNHSDEIVLELSLEPMKSLPRDFDVSAAILPSSCGSNCEVSRYHQVIDLSPRVYDDKDRAFLNPRAELHNNLEQESEVPQLPETDHQFSSLRSASHGNYDNVYREFDIRSDHDHDHPPTNSALCLVSNPTPIRVDDHRQGSVQTQELNNKKRKARTEAEHITFLNPRAEPHNNLEQESEVPQLPETDHQYSPLRSTSHGNYDNVYREFDLTRGYDHDHDHPPTNSASCLVSNPTPIRVDDHRQGSVQTQEFNNKKRKAWTEAEHRLFLEGLKRYGTGRWKKISQEYVTTKNHIQIASHAQKFFKRQETSKPQSHAEKRRRRSIHDIRF